MDLPDTVPSREREYFDALFHQMFTGFGGEAYFSTRELMLSTDSARKRKIGSAADAMRQQADRPNPRHPHAKRTFVLITMCALVPILAVLIYFCILCATALPLFFFVFVAAGSAVGTMQNYERLTPLMYVFPVAFTALPMFAFSSIFYIPLYDYAGLTYIALVWWFLALTAQNFLTRRDPAVMRDYGKMRGFKRFILTAELDRIKMLFDENPEYFSDIIPFCLVMGITKKVEKRFRPLNIVAPAWAEGISVSSFSAMSHAIGASGGGSSGGGGGGSRGC